MRLWIRALLFTLVVPGTVMVWIPWELRGGAGFSGEPWAPLGWIPVAAGAMFYLVSLRKFMVAGGTPMIYFARFLGFALGEEPPALVERGLYRYSRNPMYLGGFMIVFGQAVLFASMPVLWYGMFLCAWFQFVVTVLEEPHLRKQFGAAYEAYCRRVPRWLGFYRRAAALVCIAAGLLGVARVEAFQTSAFGGTWHGKANGLPAVTLIVQDSGGRLTGTIVFYLHKRETGEQPWRVQGGVIEALIQPRADERRLSFEVRHTIDAGSTEFGPNVAMTVEITGPGQARLGDVVLTREP